MHSRRLQDIQNFTDVVRVIGRGASLGRSLTQSEAVQAADWLLSGRVDAHQLGAFLMMLRLRGETPAEAAGLARGLRQGMAVPAEVRADIDWPVYAGKRRQLPWFLLASLVLAQKGQRVVLHGAVGGDTDRLYLACVVAELNLPIACRWDQAGQALSEGQWVYLRMESLFPQLVGWLDLKQTLGLRSVMHTVARMLNSLQATLSVRGVFHQEYVDLHAQTAVLLDAERVLVTRGDGGEAEVSADKRIPLVRVVQGRQETLTTPLTEFSRAQAEDMQVSAVAARLLALWQGKSIEPYGEATVLHTLASVLWAQGMAWEAAVQQARTSWQGRDRRTLLQCQ